MEAFIFQTSASSNPVLEATYPISLGTMSESDPDAGRGRIRLVRADYH